MLWAGPASLVVAKSLENILPPATLFAAWPDDGGTVLVACVQLVRSKLLPAAIVSTLEQQDERFRAVLLATHDPDPEAWLEAGRRLLEQAQAQRLVVG